MKINWFALWICAILIGAAYFAGYAKGAHDTALWAARTARNLLENQKITVEWDEDYIASLLLVYKGQLNDHIEEDINITYNNASIFCR